MPNFSLEEIKEQFDAITKMKIFEIQIAHTETKEKDHVIFSLEYDDTHLKATSNNDEIEDRSIEWDLDFDINAHIEYLLEECTNSIMKSVWSGEYE